MKENKKIVFVGHRDMFFGAESVMMRVLDILKIGKNISPLIVLPVSKFKGFTNELHVEDRDRLFYYQYKLIGGDLIRCVICLLFNLPATVFAFFRFIRIIPDIFYVNTSVNIFGAILAWTLKKPLIWHFHEQPNTTGFKWIPSGLFFIYKILIKRKNTTIVFISKTQKVSWEKEFGLSIPNSKVIYTPPAIFPMPQSAAAKDQLNLGFLGSFTKSKNIITLLNAFSKVKNEYPFLLNKLILMGDGEDKSNIHQHLALLQIEKDVEIWPHSKNTENFYHGIDVLVLPSFFESWGLVVLEAISQKKAVILTKNSGLQEILKNEEDCLLIDPFKEEDLVNALKIMINAPARRLGYINSAYNKLNNFQFEETFVKEINSLI